jgi:NTP pyrophosphatase (non-canonical NTP hydrolase)
MTFDEYQKQALTTVLSSGDEFKDLLHWVLGLNGEAGEVAEKLKKIIRDKGGVISPEDKQELAKELGDVLWYIAVFADHLGVSLEAVAANNIAKLADRKDRNMLKGSGDNR